jgi:hypothetical protein
MVAAIYIIAGLLPAEVEVHKRAINLFGCICRSGKTSTEWKIAERQLLYFAFYQAFPLIF